MNELLVDGWAGFGLVLLAGIVGWAMPGRIRQLLIEWKLKKIAVIYGLIMLLATAATGAGR